MMMQTAMDRLSAAEMRDDNSVHDVKAPSAAKLVKRLLWEWITQPPIKHLTLLYRGLRCFIGFASERIFVGYPASHGPIVYLSIAPLIRQSHRLNLPH
jgi:hypothetical protein